VIEIKIDNYQFIEVLGRGDNAVVFTARELMTERIVAIKVYIPNKKKGKSNITRGFEEIKNIKFNNPRIIKVHTAGIVAGLNYCILEFVKGLTLKERLRLGTVNNSDKYRIALEVLEAILCSHEENNLYHGDLHLSILFCQWLMRRFRSVLVTVMMKPCLYVKRRFPGASVVGIWLRVQSP
jgi:eukaryotic-like serine/threonine-protein kinase